MLTDKDDRIKQDTKEEIDCLESCLDKIHGFISEYDYDFLLICYGIYDHKYNLGYTEN